MTAPAGVLRCVEGTEEAFWGRRLRPDEADVAYALHRLVVADLPAEQVAVESLEFFVAHAEQAGQLLGIFTERGLVAYAVLGLPGSQDANFGSDHDLAAADLLRVAHLDGASVHPLYRGNHLQRLLIEWRIAQARMAGRSIILSTAAPDNHRSLNNLLAGGLQIRGLIVKFGGLRYLLRRDLDGDARPVAAGQWLATQDYAQQKSLLKEGWRGWQVRGNEHREIYFAANSI